MGQEPAEDRQAFTFTATVLVVLLLASILAQLPLASISEGLSSRAASFGLLWPQGWSFFSDTAHEDRTVAYRVQPDGSLSAEDTLQARPGTLWGLRRTTYFRLVETENIASRIPQSSWIPCDAAAASTCLQQVAKPAWQEFDNPYHGSTLCGQVLFAVERPTLDDDQLKRGAVPRHVVSIAPARLQCVP